MVIMLEITAETKSQDNKNQVGNRRSQNGNKGGHRLRTKEILGGNDPQPKFKMKQI